MKVAKKIIVGVLTIGIIFFFFVVVVKVGRERKRIGVQSIMVVLKEPFQFTVMKETF